MGREGKGREHHRGKRECKESESPHRHRLRSDQQSALGERRLGLMEPLVSVDTSQDQEEEEETPPSDADMASAKAFPMSRSPCDAQGRPVFAPRWVYRLAELGLPPEQSSDDSA